MSKSQTVSITGRQMFASTLGRARLFTPMNSSSAKIRESVARLLRQPIHGFGCVAHKRIYSQWLQRYMMPSVFFVATPERNATATILLLPCRLIQTASSNRLDQRGSTKLARHQQSLLLRVRLVGEQKAIAIRP